MDCKARHRRGRTSGGGVRLAAVRRGRGRPGLLFGGKAMRDLEKRSGGKLAIRGENRRGMYRDRGSSMSPSENAPRAGWSKILMPPDLAPGGCPPRRRHCLGEENVKIGGKRIYKSGQERIRTAKKTERFRCAAAWCVPRPTGAKSGRSGRGRPGTGTPVRRPAAEWLRFWYHARDGAGAGCGLRSGRRRRAAG